MRVGGRAGRSLAIAAGALFVLAACAGSGSGTVPTAARATASPAHATAGPSAGDPMATPHAVVPEPAALPPSPAAAPQSAATAPATPTLPGSPAASSSPPAPAGPTAPPTTAPALATARPTTTPASGTTIVVTLVDSAVKLGRPATPAGTITFAVRNSGTVKHDLVLLKTDLAQDKIPTDASQPFLVQEPGYLGKVADLAPGASGTITLVLAAGRYVLLCNQPAHYLVGMHAAFVAQ